MKESIENLKKMAVARLGNCVPVGESRFGDLIVIADTWGADKSLPLRSVWECRVHSWDFSGEKFSEGDGVCTQPLPGNPRIAYQFVAVRKADMGKIRRRIEDTLRKADEEKVFAVAGFLGHALWD